MRSRLEVIQEELQMKPQDDASRVVMEHVIDALREFEKNELRDIRRKSRE